MKYLFFFIFSIASISIIAQVEIVNYNLTVNGSGVDNQYIISTDFTSVNTNTLNFGSNGAYASGWPIDGSVTDYFEITITPKSGYKLNISDINFGERRSGTGIRDYQVRWSVDDFATPNTIATVNVPDDDNERTGDISGLSIDVASGETIKIRWYGYNAEGSTGNWRINNNTLNIQAVVSNSSAVDTDSKAEAPTTQVSAINIPSTAQTSGDAIDVFKFKITDAGTADGKPTKPTNIRIYKNSGSQLLDNWIKGFVLKDGLTNIPISVSGPGTAAYFDISINSGDLVIADGSSKELSLGIYLESSVIDNSSFSLFIDADNNNFTSDEYGSAFNTNFGSNVVSSTITITVAATKLYYSQQPTNTEENTIINPSPIIQYVDANNNIDEDVNSSAYNISLSTDGTFDASATTSVDPIDGICTFSNIIYNTQDNGIKLTASSADGSFSDLYSNLFSITSTPENPSIDNLFISEISDASSSSSEFLELHNVGTSNIDLSNITLNRLSADGTIIESKELKDLSGDMIIISEGYIVISRGASRATFETIWPDFPSSSGFIEGNDVLYFGGDTKYRWSITYNDGTKEIITIDDTGDIKGGSNITSNQLTVGNWTDYASGSANSTPGEINDNSTLPISLLSFEAIRANNNITLDWTTLTEYNNEYFTIERSFDAHDFISLGDINGAGNSNSKIDYSFKDNDIYDNTNLYYRLKQTDFDGKFTYSNIISVSKDDNNLNINKAYFIDNVLNINISNYENQFAIIRVRDITGKIVLMEDINLIKGIQNIRIRGGFSKNKFYHISIITNSTNESVSIKTLNI